MKNNIQLKNVGSVGEIKKQIADIGPMLPGKISVQWTQCKKKGCKCTAKKIHRNTDPTISLASRSQVEVPP